MKSLAIILATALLVSSASVVLACVIVKDESTQFEKALFDLLQNKRVKQSADCSFKNGGPSDDYFGEAAVDIGNGRVSQKLPYDKMLVVVCGEKQAVVLEGVVVRASETSCGYYEELKLEPALPPNGKFDVKAGADFAEFLKYSRKFGMRYSEDTNREFEMGRAKDRVDLLCGCKVFYPELLK